MIFCQGMKEFQITIDRRCLSIILNPHIRVEAIGLQLMLKIPPFQEIVNHAKRKNVTLLHQNNQIQDIKTTTCGYFCLYFLNEMNKGNSYYNLLEVFDIYDTMKNERFIEHYFRNI